MSSIREPVFIRGEVCITLDTPAKPHRSRCPWWRKRTARSCDCGKLVVAVSKNLVTAAGLIHYAQLGAGETPTNAFGSMSVATAVSPSPNSASVFNEMTIPSGGTQTIDTGYPKTNDTDTDNGGTVGTDVVTRRMSLGVGEGTGTLTHVAGHNTGASGTDPLLSVGAFSSSLVKGASQTGKVYINHDYSAV